MNSDNIKDSMNHHKTLDTQSMGDDSKSWLDLKQLDYQT